MAVDFFRSVDVLISDFQKRGLHPQVVETSGGTPPRTAQIRLTDRVTVHWDGESRIVWAEGPWPEFEEIENYIRKRFADSWLHRAARPDVAKRLIIVGVWLALVFGIIVPLLRNRNPIPPPKLRSSQTIDQDSSDLAESLPQQPTVVVLPRQSGNDGPAPLHHAGLKFDDGTSSTSGEPIESAADPFRAHPSKGSSAGQDSSGQR